MERDLRALREERGISLAHVQQQTRIPADVLDRFENARLVGDPSFNEVYLKALLQAYAEAIGLPPSKVLAGYEAQKAGAYDGRLRGGSRGEALPDPAVEEAGAPPPPEPAKKSPRPAEPPTAPPAVTALRTAQETQAAPPPPKRSPKARVVGRESITSSTTSIDASWGLIIGGSLIAILVLGGIMWLLLRPDGPVPEETPQTAQAVQEEQPPDTQEGESPATPAVVGQAPQLEVPLSVTVIAEDRALQGFRVTAEPDVRRPYWLEQGERQVFESETSITLWGEDAGGGYAIPSAVRLEFQGFTWAPGSSPLTISRDNGQSLLDSLHQAQAGGL